MVAAVVDPPAEPNELPDITTTKLPAIMGAVAVRFFGLFRADNYLLTINGTYYTDIQIYIIAK